MTSAEVKKYEMQLPPEQQKQHFYQRASAL
jgi:hypothetical protein